MKNLLKISLIAMLLSVIRFKVFQTVLSGWYFIRISDSGKPIPVNSVVNLCSKY